MTKLSRDDIIKNLYDALDGIPKRHNYSSDRFYQEALDEYTNSLIPVVLQEALNDLHIVRKCEVISPDEYLNAADTSQNVEYLK